MVIDSSCSFTETDFGMLWASYINLTKLPVGATQKIGTNLLFFLSEKNDCSVSYQIAEFLLVGQGSLGAIALACAGSERLFMLAGVNVPIVYSLLEVCKFLCNVLLPFKA